MALPSNDKIPGDLGHTSDHNAIIDEINNITDSYLLKSTASATYAELASPIFTGIPIAPTASIGNNNNQIATTKYVNDVISSLSNSNFNINATKSTNLTQVIQTWGQIDSITGLILNPVITVSISGASSVANGSFIASLIGSSGYPSGGMRHPLSGYRLAGKISASGTATYTVTLPGLYDTGGDVSGGTWTGDGSRGVEFFDSSGASAIPTFTGGIEIAWTTVERNTDDDRWKLLAIINTSGITVPNNKKWIIDRIVVFSSYESIANEGITNTGNVSITTPYGSIYYPIEIRNFSRSLERQQEIQVISGIPVLNAGDIISAYGVMAGFTDIPQHHRIAIFGREVSV